MTGFEFVVSIHDVAPGTAEETMAWVDDLDRIGVPATLLVIPGEFAGGKALTADPGLIGYLHEAAARGHELSLHGFRHEGVPGGPAWRRRVDQVMARGAGEFWTFFTIAVPLMRTGLTTVLLFAFIGSWNSFLLPLLVLDDSSLYPVTVGLVDWSQQSASVAQLGTRTIVGSFVSILPIIALFLALQRYWRSGLAAGGVKF
jgi:fumarate reductase subunit D